MTFAIMTNLGHLIDEEPSIERANVVKSHYLQAGLPCFIELRRKS